MVPFPEIRKAEPESYILIEETNLSSQSIDKSAVRTPMYSPSIIIGTE